MSENYTVRESNKHNVIINHCRGKVTETVL